MTAESDFAYAEWPTGLPDGFDFWECVLDGVPVRIADFDRLHSRSADHQAIACAFDLLVLDGDCLRRRPLADRKEALRKLLESTPPNSSKRCAAGLEDIVCKRITSPYRSGPTRFGSRSRTRPRRPMSDASF